MNYEIFRVRPKFSESDADSSAPSLPSSCLVGLRFHLRPVKVQVQYYGAAGRQAGMTMGIHDGGSGGGSGGGERGIEVLDSAARRVGNHCEGDDDDGDGNGGEPYVVFGYGSLIFRVRPSLHLARSLYSLTHARTHPFLTPCAFAASAARHQNK